MLETYQATDNGFICIEHKKWGRKSVNTIVKSIYFIYKNKLKMETSEKMKLLLLKFEKPGKINKLATN